MCAHNVLTIIGSNVTTLGRAYVITQEKKKIITKFQIPWVKDPQALVESGM